MKPKKQPVSHTLAFLASIFLVISLFLSRPESMRTLVWEFPRWENFDSPDSALTAEEVQTLLASYQEDSPLDTDSINALQNTVEIANMSDSSERAKAAPPSPISSQLDASNKPDAAEQTTYDRESASRIIHPDLLLHGNSSAFASLSTFFSKLNAPERSPSLHVFHFGDSQIEGDRITGELRSKWQQTWGGSGPGFLSPAQPLPSLSAKQRWSNGWNRYTRFGKVNDAILHNRYGIMASFAKYTQVEDTTSQWVEFSPHPRGFKKNRIFDEIHLLFGQTTDGTKATITINGDTIDASRLRQDSLHSHVVIDMPTDSINTTPYESLRIGFEGDSPEFHAVGLWSRTGIAVHNVAMRGSSGTLFRQLNRAQLKMQLKSVRTEMILLQYGGNAVPYLEDSAAVRRFGGWFASQIRLFQSIVPNAPIIVIGPSDMCLKVGTRMQTYPMLPYMRDVLKQKAMDENALYWDVFEVMGGAGSMAAWFGSSPSLASADHVHFTPRGAREIAGLFNKSFQTEWALWQAWQADQTLGITP